MIKLLKFLIILFIKLYYNFHYDLREMKININEYTKVKLNVEKTYLLKENY